MKATFIRITLAALAIFMMGAAFMWPSQDSSAKQQLLENANISQQVYSLYRNADYATAKPALIEHLTYLDRMNNESASPNANPYAIDAMIFTVRLANLEEKQGGAEQAKYRQEAAQRCAKLQSFAGWQNCSETSLWQKVAQMDRVTVPQ